MAQDYYWSPSKSSFYPAAIKNLYEEAGSFPSDAVLIDSSYFDEFKVQAPEGKIRGTGSDGLPSWVDAPAVKLSSSSITSVA